MKLDFHVLTVYPPHNVNRDEDGRPKTAMFGGTVRGRISSQAKKRAIRLSPHFQDLQRATRTRKTGIITWRALGEAGVEDEKIRILAALSVNFALGGGGKKPQKKTVAEFLKALEEKKSRDNIARIQAEQACDEKTARLYVLEEELRSAQALVISTKEMVKLDAWTKTLAAACREAGQNAWKKAETLCAELCEKKSLLSKEDLDEDTVLFGRMVAADAKHNVEATSMVSHAITTHRFSIEGDYFSAAEELKDLGETGAAHTSYAFFGSGVYYQHAVLDVGALCQSLGKDRARQAALAFVNGLLAAQPGGKRNSYASDVLAAYLLCSRGTAPSFNAALAFLEPVVPEKGQDLLAVSAKRLREYYDTVRTAYDLSLEPLIFAAAPSLREGNAPTAPEVWTVDAVHRFVAETVGAVDTVGAA
ncbi:type I-E CRISPR-associated protein Cas7/Cse4/CasC [Pararhodospirillum photometricum]|nr:type I-E CRISPR-associated protein Cas7/Cse4/CasC [Pararhodospirillum photometricum]